MHVKYASRHWLYPVPNVLVVAGEPIVVARAVVRAARAGDDVALRTVVAARFTVLVVALRGDAVATVVDALRATRDVGVVALRVMVCCDAERDVTDELREIVFWCDARDDTVLDWRPD